MDTIDQYEKMGLENPLSSSIPIMTTRQAVHGSNCIVRQTLINRDGMRKSKKYVRGL